jgi:hypothetical protein
MSDADLIYRTHYDARRPQRQSDPWADWNNWCDARIDRMFEESFVPGIAEFTSIYVGKRLSAETAKLLGEIADLKVQVATLTTELKTLRNSDNVNKCRLILPNG